MKSFSLLASALAVFMATVISTPVMAQQDVEEACIAKADEMQIADDKYDDFIQQCIEAAKPKDE
jgi:hypothetical protein